MEDLLLEKIRKKAVEEGVSRVFIFNPEEINVDEKAYLLCLDCKVHKVFFMRRFSCPPYSLTPENTRFLISRYKKAILINFEYNLWSLTLRNWDTFNPLVQISQKLFHHFKMKRLHFTMIKLENYAQSIGLDAFTFGSSPCHACMICGHSLWRSFINKCICKKPDLLRFSSEACGIDLYKLSVKLKIPIEIPPLKKVQYMSILLVR
jgi:predicted metal-binding protein